MEGLRYEIQVGQVLQRRNLVEHEAEEERVQKVEMNYAHFQVVV